MASAPANVVERFAVLLRDGPEPPVVHQVGKADDRVERRAQLVRHRRQELALGVVGLLGLGAARRELDVCLGQRAGPRRQSHQQEDTDRAPPRRTRRAAGTRAPPRTRSMRTASWWAPCRAPATARREAARPRRTCRGSAQRSWDLRRPRAVNPCSRRSPGCCRRAGTRGRPGSGRRNADTGRASRAWRPRGPSAPCTRRPNGVPIRGRGEEPWRHARGRQQVRKAVPPSRERRADGWVVLDHSRQEGRQWRPRGEHLALRAEHGAQRRRLG